MFVRVALHKVYTSAAFTSLFLTFFLPPPSTRRHAIPSADLLSTGEQRASAPRTPPPTPPTSTTAAGGHGAPDVPTGAGATPTIEHGRRCRSVATRPLDVRARHPRQRRRQPWPVSLTPRELLGHDPVQRSALRAVLVGRPRPPSPPSRTPQSSSSVAVTRRPPPPPQLPPLPVSAAASGGGTTAATQERQLSGASGLGG